MSEMSDAFDRVRESIVAMQVQIRDELTPVMRRLSYTLHVHWWLLAQPWYSVWWHTVTGHRTPSRIETAVRRLVHR